MQLELTMRDLGRSRPPGRDKVDTRTTSVASTSNDGTVDSLMNVKDIYVGEAWNRVAKELDWFKPWSRVLDWNYPNARWFAGAKCNIIQNAIDRHVKTWRRNKVAIYWDAEETSKAITYGELDRQVSKVANVLKDLGVGKGDRVAIYLPKIPEQVVSMLACAKIGAVHVTIYAGLGPQALSDRVADAEPKLLITTGEAFHKGKLVPLMENVIEMGEAPGLEKILLVGDWKVSLAGRAQVETHSWDYLVSRASPNCETEVMDSEDELFYLYTSGTTGKPKGVVHVHGGYMVGVYATTKRVFGLKDEDVFWCTADPAWITGHSYLVYGPLLHGATTIFYNGTPDYPGPDKWWSIIEDYRVTVFYTTPTSIRALTRYGEEIFKEHDLSSLRLLASVGEPIGQETWRWYYRNVGRLMCPVVDTWWQTETGMILIAPLPDTPLKPGSVGKPLQGIIADVVDLKGRPVPPGRGGYLAVKTPWPAMMRTIHKNPDRYAAYWNTIPGWYVAGDIAVKDEDGYFWIKGRADDVIMTAGYRIGNAEVETALLSHPAVAEAAAIGKPDPVKGEVIKAFVVLRSNPAPSDLKNQLMEQVRKLLGPIAVPSEVELVASLPKTRSGKIARRLLRAKELGHPPGDISTLEDELTLLDAN